MKLPVFALLIAATVATHAQVVINELSAASSDRLLRWLPDGSPRLGSGVAWMEGAFNDATWTNGTLPAGWGSTVATNLQSAMQNKTPSLYLRKSFSVSGAQAAMTQPVILQVDADDGFVAYINGVEVARANTGGAQHFMYASQTAYNAVTATGIVEYSIGAANTRLVPGTNTLAIQVHNKDLGSNVRVNAGLKILTSTDPVQITKAYYDYNAATGATKTYQRTGNADSNTASGTPIPGGWLATAANPSATGTWTSLNVVTGEIPGAGVAGSGGLRYTVSQTGPNGTSSVMRAPTMNMVNAWTPSSLNVNALAAATLSFRYRTTGDLQFGLRMDPSIGQEANSLDGFPTLGVPIGGTPDRAWATATGGSFSKGITSSQALTTIIGTSGSINIGDYDITLNSGVTFPTAVTVPLFTLAEDNTAGAGPGGTSGVLSFTTVNWPGNLTQLSFSVKNIKIEEWPTGAITAAVFQSSRISFRWRLPVGRTMTLYLDPSVGSGPAYRATIGTLRGTGNWEAFSATVSDLANSSGLRTRLNQFATNTISLTAIHEGAAFVSGEKVLLDDFSIYPEVAGQTLDEKVPSTFSVAAGASRTRTIDGAGNGTNSDSGTMLNNVTLFHDPGAAGMAFRIVEDVAAGWDGGPGHLRCEVTDTPDTGAPWGFSFPGLTVRNWTVGAISPTELANVSLQFSAKIRAGTNIQIYAEPVGGSSSNRVDMGIVSGTGTWGTVSRDFANAPGAENFRAALNAAGTTQFQVTFVFPSNPVAGDQLQLDDVRVTPWRLYTTTLAGGAAATQQRFLDYLNNLGSVSFVPTFSKLTTAPSTGATLSIDDTTLSYFGPDPNAAQQIVPLNAPGWKYFVALAEPSGGLFDPALLSGVAIPPGEEEDYDNPQNFRDWVELRNSGGTPANIGGWGLTDSDLQPFKWTFPAGTTIPAGGYLIVMCDGRDEANGTAAYLHANFSLSANGEKVQLYNAGGGLQHEVKNIPSQDFFHTWGSSPLGDGTYGFLEVATPGGPNTGAFLSARVKTPDFFKDDGVTPFPGGFYTGSHSLLLGCKTQGATIRYTTDGSEPTETNGITYNGLLILSPLADGKTARVIRARAFLGGMVPSDTKTQSYLLSLNANLKGVPALMLTGDAGRNFYAPHGIMAIVGGPANYDTWTPTGPDSYNIPQGHGDPYERLITAECYYPDGRDGWRDDVGIRISSSPYSRPRLKLRQTANSPWVTDHTEKPSFNLKWRDDYGPSSRTDANLIPGNDVTRYKELRIRAGKNDILDPFIVDEVSRRLYRDMGWYSPIGTISTLYVNGSFKGFFNPAERLRQSMFQEHYRTENEFDVRYIGEQVDGDMTFWNSMVLALQTLAANPTLANYANAQNYVDPVNVADYFLCNIYINCDDWPNNNWGAQRERASIGRYRMVMWDAEAAWSRFGSPINFNTIDNKLLNSGGECPSIFKNLYASPEFRLLFADRINRHMFNGGVLDDRNTSTSTLSKHVNFFKAQVDPLIRFVTNNPNESADLSWYNNHINPTTGRRAYLFGTAAGSFSNKGLWPATQPPAFSAFGGIVAQNYQLTITSPTGGTVYYTLDGSDPRATGGAIAAGAQTYTGPVTLATLATVKSRVRSAGGEWSALTEAYFQPGATAPTSSSLVISEINYHPPSATAAEAAAGYTDPDDFEFIRLTNVSATPIDLRAVRFTAGISFDFGLGDVSAVAPGASVLVVKRRLAFEARYGTSFAPLIAGEYAGGLSNSGEPLSLDVVGTTTVNIASFAFGDGSASDWPRSPDGYGPTLVLRNPFTHPNPALPENWTASAQPGGQPGGTPRMLSFAQWRALSFDAVDVPLDNISGPLADPDGDGLNNAIEFALGGSATLADAPALIPPATIALDSSVPFLTYEWTQNAGASGVTVTAETRGPGGTWLPDTTVLLAPTLLEDGSYLRRVRDNTQITTSVTRQLRLKVTIP